MQHHTTRITRAACALLAALLLALLAGGATPTWATAPGTVVVWGDTSHNQTSVPAGLSDVTAMAAGYWHSLALKSDGTVVAWGSNFYGQTSVPAGLSGVTAIAAGYYHSLALVTDMTTPAISARVAGARGDDGWYTSDVTVSWNVIDDESPISAQSGCDATTLSSDTAGTPLTCTATSTGGTISASVTIKRDATPPSTSSRVSSAGSQATVTLDAGDALSGLAATSYSVNGGAVRPYSGPIILSGAGSYIISYFSTDQAGNVEAAQTLPVTIAADSEAPTVTIEQAAGQADPASTSPISFTVVFNEPVSRFTDTDVSLSGTAGATTALVSEVAPNDGTTYNVAVSGMAASGTVLAGVPADAAQDAAGNGNSASTSADNSVSFVPAPAPAPDLTIAKTHSGTFTQGKTGAQYTISVSNGGSAPASGMVQVVDTLPSGLTATTISGTGWNCTLGTLTCTRGDALAAGSSYPLIVLTVNIAGNAPASLTNSATVSGGGEQNTANNTATDPTSIMPSAGGSGAQLVADPCLPDNRALLVSGTPGNDTIKLKSVGTAGQARVTINGTDVGTFQPSGLIIVLGQAGNDTIEVDKKLPQPRILYGNDTMKDDNGSSILIGGSGDDTLDGGDDRDILIGGVGADTLKGGVGDDILIAGSTGYDEASASSQAALCGIQAEWLRADVGYAVRVAHLSGASSGGVNGSALLKATAPGQTVFDDSSKDKLKGEDDQDWFLLNQAGGSAVDTSDRKGSEVAMDL